MISYPKDKDLFKMSYAEKNYTFSDGKTASDIDGDVSRIFEKYKTESISIRRAYALEHILLNARLHFCADELFVYVIECSNYMGRIRWESLFQLVEKDSHDMIRLHADGYESGAYTGDCDFGHNLPDYSVLFAEGIKGVIADARKRLESCIDRKSRDLYRSVVIVWSAFRKLILRYAAIAKKFMDTDDNARLRYSSLVDIADAAPKSIHAAMQLQLLVYVLIYYVTNNNVRSLGPMDRDLYGFYKNDLGCGRFTEKDIRAVFSNYFASVYAMKIPSNTPFYLCGLEADGKDASNELTRIILEEYTALDINDPKIQIRYHDDLPDDILRTVIKSISEGRNSFVFINDDIVIKSLEKLGAEHSDAVNYGIVGCYEPLCAGREIAATCSGRVMLPKAVEYAFTSGYDISIEKQIGAATKNIAEMTDFKDFKTAVFEQIEHLCGLSCEVTKAFERRYPDVNSSPFLAPLLHSCMEKGRDPYDCGAKYNNTSVNVFGIATAVDSLTAVKKAVFEEKRTSLFDLKNLLFSDWAWEDGERLRLEFLKKYPKYGNGEALPDGLAREIYNFCAEKINGVPNERGGVFRLGAFSIDWAFTFGARTVATPDGRKKGAPYSKNMCAATACDKKGVSALVHSVTGIDYTEIPNGTVLDLMLHKTVFSGDDGISATAALVRTYMKLGGFAIQINVFEPQILRAAQEMPEKYSTLQVRRCGWNVYFSELSREEQNEFIKQAENL